VVGKCEENQKTPHFEIINCTSQKMFNFSSRVFIFFSRLGFCISKTANSRRVHRLMETIMAPREIPMFRAGGPGDGGYWIPEDLKGVRFCFSPGVAKSSSFEEELASRGIQIFLADKSVDGPPVENDRFHFIKNMLLPTATLKTPSSPWMIGMKNRSADTQARPTFFCKWTLKGASMR
jgi:hypothetical protein